MPDPLTPTASALTLTLSACSTTSDQSCQPLPATLRVRPQPLPPIEATGQPDLQQGPAQAPPV